MTRSFERRSTDRAIAGRYPTRGATMTISAGELAAESLEAEAAFSGVDLISGQRVRQVDVVLSRHGIEFRIFTVSHS